MTLRQIYTKEYGDAGWKELNAQIKKLFLDIDSINKDQKPVSHREIVEALK